MYHTKIVEACITLSIVAFLLYHAKSVHVYVCILPALPSNVKFALPGIYGTSNIVKKINSKI